MESAVSPLAPKHFPHLPKIEGVTLATVAAGIRYPGRPDVLLVRFEPGTHVAGVFTRSKCASAPVEWCRENVAAGRARALVVNSGNANAFTGKRGTQAARLTAVAAAEAVGCRPGEVFLASTGVIGEPIDPGKFAKVMHALAAGARPDGWMEAAEAIKTTDTFPKLATSTAQLGHARVTINGIAKGAGMIAPDMGTMLAFVFTDAPIAPEVLHRLLARGVADSFNAVTVDGDTSTSDTLLAFATGTVSSLSLVRRSDDRRLSQFRVALNEVLAHLAEQVARDGEGASKLVEIRVEGAVSKRSARRIAMSIANSPLVKTAMAGEDPNWGRIVMAVGKAGEPADRDRLSIWFGDIRVAHRGERDPGYVEEDVAAYMRNSEIRVRVALGLGSGRDRVLTCDFTKDYVAINGSYRS
jgi:glutamate N-acetyltransferase/amino-acid N-acetyltransferase